MIPKIDGKRLYKRLPSAPEENWDVIIIGSGIGGMACGAALSKKGLKVLILEQHYLPGGFTHMFGRHGFTWDTGVHITGEMAPDEIMGKILNYLTNNEVEMISTGTPYETFSFEGDAPYFIPPNTAKYMDSLKKRFPGDHNKIDRYFKLTQKVTSQSRLFFAGKLLPLGLDKVLQLFNPGKKFWRKTTAAVMDSLEIRGRLRQVLTAQWGYYGNRPETSAFAIHGLTQGHFGNGAYYPRGGSVSFARGFLNQIRRRGGQVYTGAEVDKILIEKKTARGVVLTSGQKLYAPRIISGVGAKNTVLNLLPEELKTSPWAQRVGGSPSSIPYLCLHLGFKGDITTAGASGSNLWLLNNQDKSGPYWHTKKKSERPHTLYLSFPSLKDPDHQPGKDLIHTGECVTFIPWDEVKEWESSQFGKRDEKYKEWKEEVKEKILQELHLRVPDLMKHMVYAELSSPLTAVHFTRAYGGGIYSLGATPERFATMELRPRTPIKGFYLTGVDVAGIGVGSAMVGGALTASTIKPSLIRKLLL